MTRKYLLPLIIVLAISLKLYNIKMPIFGFHQWKQSDTAAIARNYYENGFNFFYPQVDWGGSTSGYAETEFPVFSFIAASLYLFFGVHDYVGKILAVFCSTITILFLYYLVRDVIDEKTALWSAFFYSILPSLILCGRSYMPEPALFMTSIIGIYYFNRWSLSEKKKHLFLSAIFISLAALIKLPALYLGLPLLFICVNKYGGKFFRVFDLWLFLFIVIIPAAGWYYHARQLYLDTGLTYGIWEYGSGKWGNWALPQTVDYWHKVLFSRIFEDNFTIPGTVLFVLGLVSIRKEKMEYVFDFWLLSVIIYFIIVAGGNYVHYYYNLPFLLPGVVYISKIYARNISFEFSDLISIAKNCTLLLILVFIIYNSFDLHFNVVIGSELSSKIDNQKFSKFEVIKMCGVINKTTLPNDLIIFTNFSSDPTYLYHFNRKGWIVRPNQLDKAFIDKKIKEGAKYLVGAYKDFIPDGEMALKKLTEEKNYEVISKETLKELFIIKLVK